MTVDLSTGGAAAQLLELVDDDPQSVLLQADRVIAQAEAGGDVASVAIAERAKGRALLYTGRVDEAIEALETAAAVAEAAGEDRLGALARMSLAGPLTHAGRPDDALAELDKATAILTGEEAGITEMQRAQVLHRQVPTAQTQRQVEAAYATAVRTFRKTGNGLKEAQALNSWAIHDAFQGKTAEATEKLLEARRLRVGLGLDAAVADADNNLGWVAALSGDYATAESRFAAAEATYRRLEMPLAELQNDRVSALLSAGLAAEARQLSATVSTELDASGAAADAAEAMLLHAHASLIDRDPAAARSSAQRARRAFAAQHRRGWQWQARILELRSSAAGGRARKSDLEAAERMARRAEEAGLRWSALQARLTAARIASLRGDTDLARRHLDEAVPQPQRDPIEYRTEYWAVESLRRFAAGDAAGAARGAIAGLDVLDGYRMLAGATDMRAHLGSYGAELGELGLQLAVDKGAPSRVFSWMERTRAGAMRFTPARPPADADLAAELTELRTLVAEIREVEAEGEDASDLLRSQARLQDSIRRRARRRGGAPDVADPPTIGPPDLKAQLDGRVLVSLAVVGDEMVAISIGARTRLARLGPANTVDTEAASLRSALNRLARPGRSERSRAADRNVAVHAAAELDRLLLQPLRIGDSPLVLVPPPGLAAVPWALLPSLQDRPVTVAPSADLWYRRHTQRRRRGNKAVLAAGPGLEEAAPELRAVARYYPDAIRFTPHRSPAADVAAALDGAALAHLACHGSFQPDNPMFSSLEFSDGPLYVHDLERLRRSPDTVVLSACESGLSATRPGNEMLGLAASLLTQGTRTLIGSVVPVPDSAQTRRLMTALHAELTSGLSPASALVRARAGVAADPVVAGAFVCFGAG